MDVLDRIAAVLRAFFGETGSSARSSGPGPAAGASDGFSTRPADPDLASAWDELNDYLGSEDGQARGAGSRAGARGDAAGSRGFRGSAGSRGSADSRGFRGASPPPESLRPDYANLEVPFGADIETVRRSYKRLVLRYHPDRHAGHPEKLRVATEITKKVNQSFERIRSFQERGGAGDRSAGDRGTGDR